jgi:hypothetical protein
LDQNLIVKYDGASSPTPHPLLNTLGSISLPSQQFDYASTRMF